MFNSILLSKKIEEKVCRGKSRKYYRFRPAKFYGGIASADCVGCNLRCIFCWSNDVAREGRIGKFYSGRSVAEKLVSIARKHGFNKVRITGNEPTLCKDHLLDVLDNIPNNLLFILETNGILLGYDESYIAELANYENLHVRVSLKGCDSEEFSKLTGAKPEGFNYQIRALELCVKYGVSCHAALLYDVVDKKKIALLQKRLARIHPALAELEFEPLILYPHVKERLLRSGFGRLIS